MSLSRSMVFAFAALAFGICQPAMAQKTLTYSSLSAQDVDQSPMDGTTTFSGQVTSSDSADNSTITLTVTVNCPKPGRQ